MRAFGALLLIFAGASCNAYHDDVETMLASHPRPRQEVAAPASLVPVPAKVGQWALYKQTKGSSVGYQYVSVTSDACGVWFEYVWGTGDHRRVSKVCYQQLPDLATDIATWSKLVQAVVTQDDNAAPLVVDLSNHRNAGSKTRLDLARFHANMDWGRWGHEDLPREDVDVPAGHFAKAVEAANHTHTLTMWFHPQVPITGLIKSHESDGTDLELVSYGDEGATTMIPNVPGNGQDYVECTEQPIVGSNMWKMICRQHGKTFEDDTQQKNMLGSPTADPTGGGPQKSGGGGK